MPHLTIDHLQDGYIKWVTGEIPASSSRRESVGMKTSYSMPGAQEAERSYLVAGVGISCSIQVLASRSYFPPRDLCRVIPAPRFLFSHVVHAHDATNFLSLRPLVRQHTRGRTYGPFLGFRACTSSIRCRKCPQQVGRVRPQGIGACKSPKHSFRAPRPGIHALDRVRAMQQKSPVPS